MKRSHTQTKKFYVQTGEFKTVCQSRDAESAAIWAVHQFLDQLVNLESIDWLDENEMDNPSLFQALLALDHQVIVSEIGYGRSEAGWFDMADIMTQWQQLMVAIHRMDMLFDGE